MSHHFEFPELPYAFDALEPHIDALTMEIHYTKHHRAYFDKFMGFITGTEIADESFEEIFKKVSKLSAGVRNNGGGYYNHNLFWTNLSPNGGGNPTGKVAEAINNDLGSFDAFKESFSNAAATRFGSGWAWLLVDENNKLQVSSTPNQDNPLMDLAETKGTPILCLDVWEHAYYLKYQNKRPDYINSFWNLVNWEEVEERYRRAIS
ncbi:superoxide dismutase [Bacteroidota bacterium]